MISPCINLVNYEEKKSSFVLLHSINKGKFIHNTINLK